MLGSFRFNIHLIDLGLCSLIEKNLRKIGYRSDWSWQSQLKGFYKMQYTLRLRFYALGLLERFDIGQKNNCKPSAN